MHKSKHPLILHIPHSSSHIPAEVRKDIILSDTELEDELLKLTDHCMDEIADIDESIGKTIINKYSRMVVDPERFRDDEKEIMSSVGMGAVYISTSDKKSLRNITNEKRESLLKQYYDPYYREFNEITKNMLDKFNRCLIIDVHSFPSSPLPYELNQDLDRPDICIGTNDFHTPEDITDIIKKYYLDKDYIVKLDMPFKGTFVPDDFYEKDKRVSSVMIEINRALYMDEETGEKLDGFYRIKREFEGLVEVVLNEFSS
ncbi:N-formylglutamate amidohydrolase [Spirochaetota bacterium]